MKKKTSKVTWKEIEEVSIVKTKEPSPLTFEKERTREWIQKPHYYGGPTLRINAYFKGRLDAFRKEHQEFDGFLNELGKLIEEKPSEGTTNILKFINGEPKTNWITPANSLFTVLVKLYNLCLSPKQAFEYISKCYETYLYMHNLDYRLAKSYEVFIRRSRFDGKNRKHIKIYVDYDTHHNMKTPKFWFYVTLESLVLDVPYWDLSIRSDVGIEIGGEDEIYEDILLLFEYHQNRTFLRDKIYDLVLKGLIDKGAFIFQKRVNFKCQISGDLYKVPVGVGYHLLDTIH